MKFLSFILLIQLLISCNKVSKDEVKYIPNSTSENVTTEVIKKSVFEKQIVTNGKVFAQKNAQLRFKTTEQISKIHVKNGQFVQQGTILAELENELLKNALERNQIQFDKATNKYLEEKINFGFGSKEEKDIPDNVLKTIQFKSGYVESKNALENAKLLYLQTFLKAPFSGTIANLVSKQGNLISPSEVFCSLLDTNILEVEFNVLESDVNFIKKGQSLTVQSYTGNNKQYSATISEINPSISSEGFVFIKAKIISRKNDLYDGMNVKIFVNQTINNTVVIPKEAVVLRSNREIVFTLEKGLAKWNYVTIGFESSKNYSVEKGLKIGDTIIVSNNQNLSHDSTVKIIKHN